MIIFVTILHVIACLVLIGVILIQSGRGGGLSEMLGGAGQPAQKMFGTQTSSFLGKATTYCAVMFLITSVALGVLTSQKSKSLMSGAEIKPFFDQTTTSDQLDPENAKAALAKAQAELEKLLPKKAEQTDIVNAKKAVKAVVEKPVTEAASVLTITPPAEDSK
ncbi:MAG: preprotein translocase subunit SecG [Candidatus Omnitrophota bacterium]|jgi:preprotein translocase subunit SecG